MEKFDLENFPTSESAQKMLSYVSDGFYDESYVGKWLFQVMGMEYDKALEIVEDLPAQFFPETATWGLEYHEIKWGLPVRTNLSYEERRRLIYQKRDFRAPMTPYRMEKYLEDVTGVEVHIADASDPGEYGFVPLHPNVFKAYFLGEGSLDSKVVFEILDRLKQSHTTYKVNDRIENMLDNRNLEQIILRSIRFKIGISFWYQCVYDGGWLLDGSVILNTKRRYGLVLGLQFGQGWVNTPEQIRVVLARFVNRIKNNEIFNAGVISHFGINFWGVRCFDGLWNLDGSVLLDAKRRYGLILNMGNWFSVRNETEDVKLQSLSTVWKQHILEDVSVRAIYNDVIDFCGCSAKAALSVGSEVDMSEQETVGNVTAETKTRDYWFLNGDLPLDGSRNLNSIYKKEVVE